MTTVGAFNPNPYDDAGPWGIVEINGVALPGIVLSVDGAEKPEEWNVQKPSDKAGADTVWKGTLIAEGIKIVISLTNRDQFARYYAVRDQLRPKLGTKPPTYVIANPIINFAGIHEIVCKNVGAPKWIEKEGYWTGTIDLLEYDKPKKTNTGKAGGAGQGGGAGGDNPEDEPDPDQDLLDKIAKVTQQLDELD